MTKNAPRRTLRDHRIGVACADAFRRLAEPFVPEIAYTLEEGSPQQPYKEVGDLVACAVNLAFALELYIKTLLVMHLQPVPQHHHLHHLYDALHQHAKPDIEEAYAVCLTQWNGRRSSVTLATGPLATPPWRDYGDLPKDLPSLLERSKDLFQAWRYVYEISAPESGEYRYNEFEYGPLLCACDALKAAITERMGEGSRPS